MAMEYAFRSGVSVDAAEQFLSALTSDWLPAQIVLDFSAVTHFDIGAGWRVASVLRHLSLGSRLVVLVPEAAASGDFSYKWFLAFTRSGLGIAISKYAKEIFAAGQNVTDDIRRYYDTRMRESTANSVQIVDLRDETSISVDSFEQFVNEYRRWLRPVGVAERFPSNPLRALSQLCFEAIQNVRDHASGTPFIRGTPVLSSFSFHAYKTLSRSGASFIPYYDTTKSQAGEGYVEVVVCDDGVGMAARQTQRNQVYFGAWEDERHAIETALASGGSIKLAVKDALVRGDPGFGYTHIIAALRELRAFATLRTGRVTALFDSTTADRHFRLLDEQCGYLPGTVLQVIFPKPPSVQLGFEGFGIQ